MASVGSIEPRDWLSHDVIDLKYCIHDTHLQKPNRVTFNKALARPFFVELNLYHGNL